MLLLASVLCPPRSSQLQRPHDELPNAVTALTELWDYFESRRVDMSMVQWVHPDNMRRRYAPDLPGEQRATLPWVVSGRWRAVPTLQGKVPLPAGAIALFPIVCYKNVGPGWMTPRLG